MANGGDPAGCIGRSAAANEENPFFFMNLRRLADWADAIQTRAEKLEGLRKLRRRPKRQTFRIEARKRRVEAEQKGITVHFQE